MKELHSHRRPVFGTKCKQCRLVLLRLENISISRGLFSLGSVLAQHLNTRTFLTLRRFAMRAASAMIRFSAIVLAFAVANGSVASEIAPTDHFPYRATVRGSDAYLRSGPSKEFYVTDKLRDGTVLEVWRHDPGDWVAVRPTRGCFSWVAARHLRVKEDNIAEIASDSVAAYVGSNLNDVRHVSQVRLKAGEVVEIVGHDRLITAGGGASETWYKIAPPAGEFRWLAGAYLENYVSTSRDDDALAQSGSTAADKAASQEKLNAASTGQSLKQAAGAVTFNPAKVSGEQPKPTVEQLDLELSRILTNAHSNWSFAEIHARAREIERNSESALDRGKARKLLDEVIRCQQLKEGYEKLARGESIEPNSQRDFSNDEPGSPTRAPQPINRQAKLEPVGLQSSAANATAAEDYDGFGRLVDVVSRRVGAPRFALTDERGELVMLVSPAPGVNLRPYVGKIVGLGGFRGYMPQIGKPHLTASFVKRMDDEALIANRPQ